MPDKVNLTAEEFDATREWYLEWSRIPRYLVTISLALLAFSLTDLLPQAESVTEPKGNSLIKAAWLVLSLSSVSAGLAALSAYASFDLFTRVFLARPLQLTKMKSPSHKTKWVSIFGKVSYRAAAVALVCLLAGAICLVLYAFEVR